MNTDDTQDNTVYKVVLNHEEQYSIWPADRDPPAGWHSVGSSAGKAECLEYVKRVWVDTRPLSLRLRHAQVAGTR